jgi:hypothetical protein
LWAQREADRERPWVWRSEREKPAPVLNCVPSIEAQMPLREAMVTDDSEVGARILIRASADAWSAGRPRTLR